MVCTSCEKKYGTTKLITGSIKGTVVKGASNSTAPGGSRNGKNKLLSRPNPYGLSSAVPKKCRDCKKVLPAQESKSILCNNCAYSKGSLFDLNKRGLLDLYQKDPRRDGIQDESEIKKEFLKNIYN
jgi:hypothetical protein